MSLKNAIREKLELATRAAYIEELDATVYSTPLSAGDAATLQKRHPSFPLNMSPEAMVDLVILKSLEKDGSKAFDLEDKPILLKWDLGVISSITAAIIGGVVTIEDAEKN